MRIKNIVFDLDGTLLDTTEGILESVKYAAKKLGYEKLPYSTLLKFVGPPIQNSFIQHYGCDSRTAQYAADIFRDYYKNTALLKAKPYDGIFDLCEHLKNAGIRMSVATYKREDYALTLLCHFGFDRYCNPIHGADNNNILKKADIVNMCLEEMGGTSYDSVLIGDTEHDALGAKNAGINFIAVTYGFGFRNAGDISQYPYIGIAQSPAEIEAIVEKEY